MTIIKTVSVEQLVRSIEDLAEHAEAAVKVAVVATIERMARDVVANRMSGQLLGVVTGTARRSITTRYETRRGTVRGMFGSGLKYVRAHEQGFAGTVKVKAHTRDPSDRATHQVSAHTRVMAIRARRFMRASFDQEIPNLEPRVRRAILHLANTGRIPTLAEVG